MMLRKLRDPERFVEGVGYESPSSLNYRSVLVHNPKPPGLAGPPPCSQNAHPSATWRQQSDEPQRAKTTQRGSYTTERRENPLVANIHLPSVGYLGCPREDRDVSHGRSTPESRTMSDLPAPVQRTPAEEARLASEQVILQAPMSFMGSAKRIWPRITKASDETPYQLLLYVLAVLAVFVAWIIVLAWYVLWGLMLIPYRIIRRGSRKRRMEELRHREQLQALERPRQ
jgi:hypothetical protein